MSTCLQSKVTAVVKSSEDDLWFLDDSDEFSVEVNDSFLSRTDDPPFSVEYEVDSDSDNRSADTGSQSSVEVRSQFSHCSFFIVVNRDVFYH